MYDLIALYRRAYDPNHPVVCIDEKSKQLLASVRPTIKAKSGDVCKEDSQYERHGTSNIFVAVEPKGKWRLVQVTQRRCQADFVHFVEQLLTTRDRHVQKLHLVLDNLNIHFAKSCVDVLGADKANKLLERLEFHSTPIHGSWLNLAEVEISVMSKQCLNRRIATQTELKIELEAWQSQRNAQNKGIQWRCTRKAIDQKLGQHYVA